MLTPKTGRVNERVTFDVQPIHRGGGRSAVGTASSLRSPFEAGRQAGLTQNLQANGRSFESRPFLCIDLCGETVDRLTYGVHPD